MQMIKLQVAVKMSKADQRVRMEWKHDISVVIQDEATIERWQDINWKPVDGNDWFSKENGVPQGGVISPLLANIALHGMEERLRQYAETLPGYKTRKVRAPKLIRYADDFVVLHPDLEVIQECQTVISEWLRDIGLELNPNKTRISHTLKAHTTETPGFDFLGFNVRQYRVGRYQSGKDTQGNPLGFKTLIKPSRAKVICHYRRVAEIIASHNTMPQSALISHLNPVINGWVNYYSTVVSKEIFSRLDHLIWQRLMRWGQRRHPNKGKRWIIKKYWQSINSSNWIFAEVRGARLALYSDKPIQRHVKVRDNASPYDGDLVYWSSRMGKHPEMPRLLSRRIGTVAPELRSQIETLPLEQLEDLGEALLDFQVKADLEA